MSGRTVSPHYLDGIREGREFQRTHGLSDAQEILDNLNSTIQGFDAQNPVGQFLRGERDFWRNQIKIRKG